MKMILNSNSIQYDTGKALLIKLPNSDFKFWHPKRFCNSSGKGGYQLSIWFGNQDWKIKASRTGKSGNVLGEWEKPLSQVADEFEIKIIN